MKARLHIPQPVRLQNISELTQNAREQTVNTPQENGTETLSIHVDFTADSFLRMSSSMCSYYYSV